MFFFILQADELSITVVPFSANFGAHSREVFPPAENKAISGEALIVSSNPIIFKFSPLNKIVLPIDFSDATGINSLIGMLRSFRTSNITFPTIPVTPTIASLIF